MRISYERASRRVSMLPDSFSSNIFLSVLHIHRPLVLFPTVLNPPFPSSFTVIVLALHRIDRLLVLHRVVYLAFDFLDFGVFMAPGQCWRCRRYPEDLPFYLSFFCLVGSLAQLRLGCFMPFLGLHLKFKYNQYRVSYNHQAKYAGNSIWV